MMVDKRCAIKMVIRSLLPENLRMVLVISSSVMESSAEVASSKINKRGFLVGHKSSRTTEIYTHVSMKSLISIKK